MRAISYPSIWVGFSPRGNGPRVEYGSRSVRIGSIRYVFSLGIWTPYLLRKAYRRARKRGEAKEVAKTCVRWHHRQARFWKLSRFILNFPGRLIPWLKGHFE